MEINEKRATEICKVVLDAYTNKKGLFALADTEVKMLPEKQLVNEIKNIEKKALWLFFACPGDKMVDSRRYYKQWQDFYLKNQDFFDERYLKTKKKFDLRLFFALTQQVKLAFPTDFREFTEINAKRLYLRYNSNPLNIIKYDFKKSVKNLKQFMGYGTGEATLYLIFLSRYGIKKIKGLAPKVDRHFMRISAGCNVFELEEGIRIDKVVRELEKTYKKICDENNFNVLILDPATWIIGKELCGKNDDIVCKVNCPLDNYCNKNLPVINRKNARLYKRKKPSKRSQLVLPLKL